MSKQDYVAVNRIESREKNGEKKVIAAGTKLQLTDAEAKKLGSAVQKVAVDEPEVAEGNAGDAGE